jgi:hypothetical protein
MPVDTTFDVREADTLHGGRLVRRCFTVVLVLLVALGLTGALGIHTSTAHAAAGATSVRVDYPRVARAGQDTLFRVTVRHDTAFGSDPVVIAISKRYFEIFETQGFEPGPDAESATDRYYYLEFDSPPGRALTLTYDSYIQPGSQIGRSADVVVTVGDEQPVRTRITTWLVP